MTEETLVLVGRLIALGCFVFLILPVVARIFQVKTMKEARPRIGTAFLLGWAVYIQAYSFWTVAVDYIPDWGRLVASTFACVSAIVCVWAFWPFNSVKWRKDP